MLAFKWNLAWQSERDKAWRRDSSIMEDTACAPELSWQEDRVHPRACVSWVRLCSQVTLAADLSHNLVSVLSQTCVVHLCCGHLVLQALQGGTCTIRLTHQFLFLSCEIRRWSMMGPTTGSLTLWGTVDSHHLGRQPLPERMSAPGGGPWMAQTVAP